MKKSTLMLFILLIPLFLQGCTDAIKSNSYKAQADKYFEQGDYKNALLYYDKALDVSSKKVGALGGKAKTLEALGKYDEAIIECDRAIKINSGVADVYNTKANALSDKLEFEKALENYRDANKIDPDNAVYINNISYALNMLERYEDSVEYSDRAIVKNSRLSTAYLNKGYALEGLNKASEAIELYDKAIKYDPNNIKAYIYKADILNNQSKYSEAIELYDKAINLSKDKGNIDALAGKGDALCNMGKYEDSVKCFDKAIDLAPDNHEIYVFKARSLYYLEKYKESKECLDKALDIDKKSSYAKLWKAKNLAMNEEYEKAEELCKQVLDADSSNTFAYDVKGCIYLNQSRFKEAINMFDKAISIEPDYREAIVDRISASFYMKNYDECISLAKKELKRFPKNIDILWYLGDSYSYIDLHKEAIDCYKKILDINPDYDQVLALTACEYYILQDFKNSEEYNNKALKVNKSNKTASRLKAELEKRKFPESRQVSDFIKENYLYLDKVKDFDKKSKRFIANNNVSVKDIEAFIKSIKPRDDIFTFVVSGKAYDELTNLDNSSHITSKAMANDIFYVGINSFTSNTSRDFKKAIDKINIPEQKNLVIDLRDNSGGLTKASNEILDLLLPKCTTSYLIYRDGYMDSYYSDDNLVKFKRIFVFTNERSASSSELLALGLKKYLPNVTIVGRPTLGKGVGQTVYENKSKKYLIYLVSFYWNVKEKNIMGQKITPDVRVNGNNTANFIKAIEKQIMR
jgi:tetratricopeptide (TPR) repeat protein